MSRKILGLAGAAVLAAAGFLAWSEWKQNRVPPGPPQVAGRILFVEKRCVRCHKVAGVGGRLGPDLTEVSARRAPAWLNAYVREPRSIKPDAQMPRPRLTDAQRAAVLAYLATLDGSSEPVPPEP